MDEQTRSRLRALTERLNRLRRRTTAAGVLVGLIAGAAAVAGVWVLAALLESFLWMPGPGRALAVATVVLAGAGALAWYGGRALLRHVGLLGGLSHEHLARRVGAAVPAVEDRLVNLLHLSAGRGSPSPSPLLAGAIARLERDLCEVPVERVERFEAARRALRVAWVPPAVLLIFWVLAPTAFTSASARLLAPARTFVRPAPFALTVLPGDAQVMRGDTLVVEVRAEGRALPARLTLESRRAGEAATDAVVLQPDSAGVYRHTFVNVRQALEYRAAAEPVASEWFDITVAERPVVSGLQLVLVPPSYAGLPRQVLAAGIGDVTALPGTRVEVEAAVSGEAVQRVALDFGAARVDLPLDGETARGAFVVRGAATYRVVATGAGGLESLDPITYTVTPLRDEPPAITLEAPEADYELDDSLTAPLRFRFTDDYGFSRLALVYRIAERRFGEPADSAVTLALPLGEPRVLDQGGAFDWLLRTHSGLDILPGDVVEYHLEVWDNDAFSGPKSARSATHRLLFRSLAEQYEALDESQDNAEQQIEDLLQQSDAARENFERLRDELRRQQEGDWEDDRQLESLQSQQEQLSEQVEQLSQQMEDLADEMRDHGLASEETMEKYRQLQQVIEEIDDPALREALDKLREALEGLDLEQMEQAFEQFEFNEEQYRERLERALELFKNLRIQQDLEEAARRAEALAEQQEQLEEATRDLESEQENAPDEPHSDDPNRPQQEGAKEEAESQEAESQQESSQEASPPEAQPKEEAERLAAEQQRSAEEARQLEQQLKETLERMQESRTAPKQQMEQLNEEAEQAELPQNMEQNAEQLRQQQLSPAARKQQQMQQQLRQMQQQLQQMKQQMDQQSQQMNVQALRRALDDVLRLSQQQESLRLNVQSSAPDNPALRDAARRQTALSESFQTVSDSIQAVARRLPNVNRVVQRLTGEATREMERATEQLGERQPPQAAGHQKAAMTQLNELALRLSDLLNQAMNGQMGQGSGQSLQQMLEQMGKMTGEQQGLNEQIQQMLNEMQGERLTPDGQQRLRQMAEQQAAIRRQLRQMSRNPEARGKLLGDLEEISRQMEESIEEMQRGRADRPLIERQQQILTRLLEAQRSMQQRGQEERREKRAPRDYQQEQPSALPPSEAAEQLRRDLIRALESGYAPDYQNLIKRYFELLQAADG